MSCHRCDCLDCQIATEEAEQEAFLDKKFNEWNWNSSHAEIAQDILENHEADKEELLSMIETRFGQAAHFEVENCIATFE